jgi:2-deoxy-D-gluconate 3-dehydrogenase
MPPSSKEYLLLSNNFSLAGKAALVTGGNGGIGLGMAKALAAAGATLAIAGRDEKKNAAAARELGALALNFDLKDERACRAMVEEAVRRLGRLDILVNNAGINVRKAPQDYTLEEWRLVLDTNLTSAFVASQAAYAPMKAAGGGKIVNIGSMMSLFGASFAAPYGASKGGIVQLTKSLAAAWAADNIQVNAVLPGWIDTALTRRAREEVAGLHERVLARTPAGRWGAPEDLGGIAVFLASPASDFITGTAIPVDGGYSALG